jgi:hypothetical protein
VNVYVFFFSQGSIAQVKQAAQAASLRAPDDPALSGRAPPAVEGAAAPAPPPVSAVGSGGAIQSRKGTVRDHEGLGAVLRREGLSGPDADAALRALQPIMNFKKEVRGGQAYTIRLAGGRLEWFELKVGGGITCTAQRGADGKFAAERVEAPKSPARSKAE